MKMRFGYSSDFSQLSTWAINRVTGGHAHCFVIFHNGRREFYFESIFLKKYDWKIDGYKNGVRGPIDFCHVVDWVKEKPEKRKLMLQPYPGFLPFSEDEVLTAFNLLSKSVHTIHYAPLQIVSNWIAARTGLEIRYWRTGAKRWTCSETNFRTLPNWAWKYYGLPDVTADSMAPGGDRLPSIEHGTASLLKDHPAID